MISLHLSEFEFRYIKSIPVTLTNYLYPDLSTRPTLGWKSRLSTPEADPEFSWGECGSSDDSKDSPKKAFMQSLARHRTHSL